MHQVFVIGLYIQVCLASLILGVGEEAMMPYGLTLPIAIGAWFLTEATKTLRISSRIANTAAVIALMISALEFFGGELEGAVLAGAHLLVYLSWLVLIQMKEHGHYWRLAALGVLQVALASVLTSDITYGLLLAVYLLLSIWNLSVFSLKRTVDRYDNADDQTAGVDNRTLSTEWDLARENPRSWLNLRFAGGVVFTTGMSAVIAALFFMLIPRVWVGRTFSFDDSALEGSMTGFTEEVRLGDMGEILESTSKVFEVSLSEQDTGEPVAIGPYCVSLGQSEPTFRGAVLVEYRKGEWTSHSIEEHRVVIRQRDRSGLVRQDYAMEPGVANYLFSIHPVISVDVERTAGVHNQQYARGNAMTGEIILVNRQRNDEPIGYTVYSPQPGTLAAKYHDFAAALNVNRRSSRQADFLQLPDGDLTNLQRIASEVVRGDDPPGTPEPTDLEKAQRLLNHLKSSGEYSYTLDLSVDDGSIDPIEDFLINRKVGHCEYFASALALMLRASGVKSRLVSGFKGGRLNRFSGSWVVEQRHAHAWVEARIDKRWVTLDPTPADRDASVRDQRSMAWEDLSQAATQFWSSHIAGLNIGRQQTNIYQPLRIWFDGFLRLLRDLRDFLTSPRNWFSLTGFMVAFSILWLMWFAGWLIRKFLNVDFRYGFVFRRLWDWLRSLTNPELRTRMTGVEFWDRFRRLASRVGLERRPSQTQLEFAAEAAAALQERVPSSLFADTPMQIAALFYQARFSTTPVSAADIEMARDALVRMERAVSHLDDQSDNASSQD